MKEELIRSELYSPQECSTPVRIVIWILTGVLAFFQLIILNLGGLIATLVIGVIVNLIISLLFKLIYRLWIEKYEIVVTENSVCWFGPLGVECYLPFHKITGVQTQKFLWINLISVSTPSKRVSFSMFRNSHEIYDTITTKLHG